MTNADCNKLLRPRRRIGAFIVDTTNLLANLLFLSFYNKLFFCYF